MARDSGLEPLALGLLHDPSLDPDTAAAAYVNAELGVADAAAALEGARWILMERFAEDAELRRRLPGAGVGARRVASTVVAGKEAEGVKFSDYFNATEQVKAVPSHRVLALLRGRKEGVPAALARPARRRRARAE